MDNMTSANRKSIRERIADMSQADFDRAQIISGIILAALSCFSILWVGNRPDWESMGLILAVTLCAGVPNLLGRLTPRPLKKLNSVIAVCVIAAASVYIVFRLI